MQKSVRSRFTRQQRGATSPSSAGQVGFTLVEMAVVLVIIGVILSAVMIGRDAQRNAEYLRIRQTFVNQWAVAYNSYAQRTGVPVGDNIAAPRLMVNGINYAGSLGGDLTGNAGPGALCQGSAAPGIPVVSALNLRALILGLGIELPNGRGLNSEDRYVYLDTNGNPQELQVCFQWNAPATPSGAGNVMVITGLTPDLAQSLDASIDGQAAADLGSFRQFLAAGIPNAGAGVPWVGNNAQAFSGAAGTRDTQVLTVIAHYKMNQ